MRKNSSGINDAITIARGVMERLLTEGERDLAKGAEKVWNTLITARNSASDFDENVINFPIAKNNDAHKNKRQVK